jgi:rhamnulokinase
MRTVKNYIAVDLGADSGRVILGCVSDSVLELKEIHRFSNGPIIEAGSLRWNFNKILSEIKTGIAEAVKQSNGNVAGIAVDSWGVDFGLIDDAGHLIENPFYYRDHRTDGILEKALAFMDRKTLYENTGIQFMQINTLYQLLSMRLANYPPFNKSKQILFIADLCACHLCGRKFAESSLASTSQLMNMKQRDWSREIFDAFKLNIEIMPPLIQSGTKVGQLKKEIMEELDCPAIPVIAAASHDTASAVAAVPAEKDVKWAYLSCGTWSLVGMELAEPVINEKTYAFQFTNEGGVENTIRLLKNIMGLWLVQECKRQWHNEGVEYSYADLVKMAAEAKPFIAYIDSNTSSFLSPGDMPAKINTFLMKTGQHILTDKGQMIRSLLESLAFEYRLVIEKLEDITDESLDCLYMVGGGIKNELLCQFTANATGKRVIAGPVEAASSGNILMQAKALGQLQNLSQIRQIVRNSFELREYHPENSQMWEEQYQHFQKIKSKCQ